MSDPVQSHRLFAWIAVISVAGLLSACQPPAAPKNSAVADDAAETYDEVRGDGMGGGMGDY